MNAFLFTASIIVFGVILDSGWLALLGIAGLFVALVTYYVSLRREYAPVPSGGTRHKILQAPQDAWDQEDIATYMSAISGLRPMPMNAPEDQFRSVSEVFEKKGQEVPRDVLRNTLPFSNYGRKSIFEHVFIGLPVNIGTLIKKK